MPSWRKRADTPYTVRLQSQSAGTLGPAVTSRSLFSGPDTWGIVKVQPCTEVHVSAC